MSEVPLTLKAFFANAVGLVVNGADMLAGLKGKLPAGEAMTKAVEQAMEEIFETSVGDVLQESWEKVDGLMEALKHSREHPDTVAFVPLMDHSVGSTHSPKIDLFVGQKRLAELALQIELNLHLKGVALELRGGRIVGLRSGHCAGEGVCSLGGKSLIERKTPDIALPGRLAFSDRAPAP